MPGHPPCRSHRLSLSSLGLASSFTCLPCHEWGQIATPWALLSVQPTTGVKSDQLMAGIHSCCMSVGFLQISIAMHLTCTLGIQCWWLA